MTINLFTFVGLYDRAVATTAHLLSKGAAHAAETGVGEIAVLDWRLIEDMHPLRFQVMVVCNFARAWPARAAGLPPPQEITSDLDLAGFNAALAQTRAYLAALTPEAFDDREDAPLTIPIGAEMRPTLPASQWLAHFATTNIHFHMNMTYAILRAHGVKIGKLDLFPLGL